MRKLVRKLDEKGRTMIPSVFRELLELGDEIELELGDDCLIIRPHHRCAKCMVTDKITDDLDLYAGSIVLSDEGARKLYNILKERLEKGDNDEM